MTQVNCQENQKYKVGFIGYGSMGKMLITSFISSGKVNPKDIIVSTRTKGKMYELKLAWDDISIASNNVEVAERAKHIFLCVKPIDIKTVLEEIKDFITSETHIISIAGPVKIANIESITNGQVSKLTPTLTSEVVEGVSLLCHGDKVTRENAAYIEALLQQISVVKLLNENDFKLAADITSCGPGLFSSLFQELVYSAVRKTENVSKEAIEEMLMITLSGTLKLYFEKNMSLEEIITRVATKGGITEEGINVLRRGLPQIFDNMFLQTLTKHKKVASLVNSGFDVLTK